MCTLRKGVSNYTMYMRISAILYIQYISQLVYLFTSYKRLFCKIKRLWDVKNYQKCMKKILIYLYEDCMTKTISPKTQWITSIERNAYSVRIVATSSDTEDSCANIINKIIKW